MDNFVPEGYRMGYKILSCIGYLAGISLLAFFVGRMMPYSWFSYDRFPYKSFPFEKNGKIYLKLKINKWQSKVPDMSKIFPDLIPAKKLLDNSEEALNVLIKETCIAELIHWMFAVIGLAGLWICPNVWGGLIIFVYVVVGHFPFILIQRYNRPRLVKLLKRMQKSHQKQHAEKEGSE